MQALPCSFDASGSFEVDEAPLAGQAPKTRTPSLNHSRLSLFGAFCATLASGSVYGWGTIASNVGVYGYSPDDKLLMGTISSLSVYITFHTGVFFDAYGARTSLVLGGILAVGGWLLTLWGITNQHSALLVGLYLSICGQSVLLVVLPALESVRNFPLERKGTYSSIVLTGFGLTSTVMSLLSKYVFKDDLKGFLITMATSSGIFILFQLIVFAEPPPPPVVPGASGCSHLLAMFAEKNTLLFIFVMVCFGMELFFFTVNIVDLNAACSSSYEVADLLTAFSLCNVLTRPTVGLLSDSIPLSRAQLLGIGSSFCVGGMVCLVNNLMLPAALVAGFCDGFMFAVWVPLTREVHGLAQYGITFSTYQFTLGVGNMIVNFCLIHLLGFEKGPSTALVCCGLMSVSVAAALLLHWRLQRLRNIPRSSGVSA